jgi:hypothetical protein
LIGVGEDGTIVGRKEVKSLRGVFKCEFFDDENQRYRDVPVSVKKLR